MIYKNSFFGHLLASIVISNFTLAKVCDLKSNIVKNHIEYHPSCGLNLVIGAPHGGWREPDDIPNRESGCWNETDKECIWKHNCGKKDTLKCKALIKGDLYTRELALNVRNNLCSMFGGLCPALIANLLSRRKMDANRNISEATFHENKAVEAFNTFHGFIETEKQKISSDVGGLFIDIHGHGHKIQRAEIGYLIKNKYFDRDIKVSLSTSSMRSLAMRISNDTETLEALLRGNRSLGWFFEENNYAAVPSRTYPSPGNDIYFSGGYNTLVHGSSYGGYVDAVQIESCRSARDPENINDYSCSVAHAIKSFLCQNYYFAGQNMHNNVIRQSCQVINSKKDCINA